MRTLRFLAVLLLVLPGCTDSHVVETTDSGLVSDAAPADASAVDAATSDASLAGTCRLSATGITPGMTGQGCFCDGPFVVRGDLAYRLAFMLEVIDLRDPDHPVLVASLPQEARYSSDIAIVGDVLFVAGGPVERFDLSDPRAPVSLGVVDLGGDATALAVDGAQLVVALRREDGSHAIRRLDATDPRALVLGAPIERGALDAGALALSGTTGFAVEQDVTTGGFAVTALDLTTGAILSSTPRGTGSGLSALVAHAGHLFLSDLSSGVRLFDARDPSALIDLGQLALEATTVFSLDRSGDRLIVMGQGVWLYDLADPRALAPLGHLDWAEDLGHAALLADHLLVSGGNHLVSLPLVCD